MMFESLEAYVEPLIILIVALVVISGYFRMQEHATDAREQAKIQKAEIYAQAKIQSAKIEANAEQYGFEDPDDGNIDISSLLPLLQGDNVNLGEMLKNPEVLKVAQSYLSKDKP